MAAGNWFQQETKDLKTELQCTSLHTVDIPSFQNEQIDQFKDLKCLKMISVHFAKYSLCRCVPFS